MAELTLRRANLADAATIAEFNRRLAWESERITLDADTLLAGVTAGLADPHKGFYTVAERAGEIVGQTLVTYEWSDWRNGWFWWIQSVYVREDARRGGVFRSLYRHLERLASDDPTVIGLRLYVEANNDRAKNTYRSLGMTDTTYGLLEVYPLPGRERHAIHS
ncbi:MAG: GNAT family N-acetyltransferase [Planctomycetia bacterium]|nr:GNAT family N-acetyltransferase [Planctomycetia bacterium]